MTGQEIGQTTLPIARSLYAEYSGAIVNGAVCDMTNALMLAFCEYQAVAHVVMQLVEKRKTIPPDNSDRTSIKVRSDIHAEYKLKALKVDTPSMAALNNAMVAAYLESRLVRELTGKELLKLYMLEAPSVTPV